MTHQCTGCPRCDPEMRALLGMDGATYSRWLTKRDQQLHGGRTLAHLAGEKFPAPDPYREGIRRIQEEDAKRGKTPVPSPRPTEIPLDKNGVPDPYFHELERMRNNR